eukprot:Em0827g1a
MLISGLQTIVETYCSTVKQQDIRRARWPFPPWSSQAGAADIMFSMVPKWLCGQQPIAPCPNVLNSGSVVAPSSECAYLLEYGIESTKFIPSLNPTCLASLQTACSNSTYCSPSCLAAITAAEKHGGCCYAQYLNGPKALCGQQPIAPCSTTVSRGSLKGLDSTSCLILFMAQCSVQYTDE